MCVELCENAPTDLSVADELKLDALPDDVKRLVRASVVPWERAQRQRERAFERGRKAGYEDGLDAAAEQDGENAERLKAKLTEALNLIESRNSDDIKAGLVILHDLVRSLNGR